jgi:fatty acid desaturase
MPREARRRDRLVGLFALGLVLLNPPVLWMLAGTSLAGWPLPFVYLFCAWAALVATVALIVEHKRDRRPAEED